MSAPTHPMAGGVGPLAGLRVLELGQYISAPYAAKLLADMGADVLKIESPDGDPMRRWEGNGATHSPQFAVYNRNKSSLVLDLKSPEGLHELHTRARNADVLIENFRPGVSQRLGFDYPVLSELNPRLILCSITGFGSDGPYARRPAYDSVISAMSGMYSQVVPAETMRPLGPAFSDLISGMSAVQAILAAVHARNTDGAGQHVEVSMLGSVIDFLVEPVSTYLRTGVVSRPESRSKRAQTYACTSKDDLAFVVHMSVPEKFWSRLIEVLERPDLSEDARFATRELRVANYEELEAALNTITVTRPRHEWLAKLVDADIPHAPVNRIEDLFDDVQVSHMDLLVSVPDRDGQRLQPRHSTIFHSSGSPAYRSAPQLDIAVNDVARVAADEAGL